MGEYGDERQVSHWLRKNGISDQHQQLLINQDKMGKELRLKDDTTIMPTFIVGKMVFNGIGRILYDEPLGVSIDRIECDDICYVAAFRDFQRIREKASNKLEIVEFARMIKPFSVGEVFEGYISSLIGNIADGQLKPEYFPWQNRYIAFLLQKPNFTSDKERRHYYSEIPWEYQECAIVSVDGMESMGNITPERKYGIHPTAAANVWRSYLPTQTTPSKKTKQSTKTMKRYERWYMRYLEIKQAFDNTPERFTDNKAHEQIAEEEKADVSTIAKGIKAYLQVQKSWEISENS